MNNAINMLPCPMCGCSSINVKNEQPTDNSGGYFIECPDCGISTSLRYACGDDPIPLLTEQWNRRATAQCLHQIAEPAAPHAARDLGIAALEQYLKECEENQIVPDVGGAFAYAWQRAAAPQAVQAAVPSDAEIDAAIQAFDWEGWTDPEKAKRAFTREALSRWTAPAHPAEGVSAQRAAFVDAWEIINYPIPCNSRMRDDGSYADPEVQAAWEKWQARASLAATQPAADAVASIYVMAGGEREFDDWRVPLSVGQNLLYTHPAQPAAQGMDAQDAECLEIGSELYRACAELPLGYEIILYLEQGAGTVHWMDPDGNEHDIGEDGVFSEKIGYAIAAAQAKQGGADHG